MTREQLFDAMVNRTNVLFNSRWCIIQSIQMEDGSGYNFNVHIEYGNGNHTTIFVRCPRPNPTLN